MVINYLIIFLVFISQVHITLIEEEFNTPYLVCLCMPTYV